MYIHKSLYAFQISQLAFFNIYFTILFLISFVLLW